MRPKEGRLPVSACNGRWTADNSGGAEAQGLDSAVYPILRIVPARAVPPCFAAAKLSATPNERPDMPVPASQIVEWLDRLIEERIRMEAVHSKREELLKRNIGKDLIQSSIEESQKKIARAKTELTSLFERLEQK